MSRYRKWQRKRRLEIVGREWIISRRERRAVRNFPNELVGREREDGICWKGKVEPQNNSALWKLPREVRDMIWEEAAGGYLVHLSWLDAYRKLQFSRCKGDDGICVGPDCQTIRKGKGVPDLWGNIDLIGYLLVCRKMYDEILPILYGENCFSFGTLDNILRFSITIPRQQMSMIRRVQWYFPKAPESQQNGEAGSPWPKCNGSNEECYCLWCWKKETWAKDYCETTRAYELIPLGLCGDCWERNPASEVWK
ncbi:hypothetical protein EYC84_005009 [Monilinia fructicola]|uniref:DUF7730 domain-containing protein n=1 Tax=Monilinia fructicola TaxID=38448 RepID=A0A5M9JY68_MONFR|nr:hypothetical protein EYC84_005009 [Monilinia fructicola]